MLVTGIGSMPGDDIAPVLRYVLETLAEDGIVFVPELPDRGVQAGMIGRTVGLLPLPIDLQPAGWRLTGGSGRDQRRASSLLRQDLDIAEEVWADHPGPIKQQIVGPLTLSATLEKMRGDKVVADHGARREVAAALVEAIGDHVAQLRRRFIGDLVVQIDEPGASAMLNGRIPTASGFGRHRTVHPPEADDLLRPVVDAIRDAGATPVVHSCSSDVPIGALVKAGFAGLAVDLSRVDQTDGATMDDWAELIESGVAPWLGTGEPRAVEEFLGRLGFGVEAVADQLILTPSCGLAGHSPGEARASLAAVVAARGSLVT